MLPGRPLQLQVSTVGQPPVRRDDHPADEDPAQDESARSASPAAVGATSSTRLNASGTTQTKWCSQDTGEASRLATPHSATAKRTSPARCQTAAAQTPRPDYGGAGQQTERRAGRSQSEGADEVGVHGLVRVVDQAVAQAGVTVGQPAPEVERGAGQDDRGEHGQRAGRDCRGERDPPLPDRQQVEHEDHRGELQRRRDAGQGSLRQQPPPAALAGPGARSSATRATRMMPS